MKKRIISLLFVLCFTCTCSMFALASGGLDLNVLRNGKDIQFSEDNQTNIADYLLKSVAENKIDTFYSNDGSSISITPNILADKSRNCIVYNFDVKFVSNRFLNLQRVIFIIGDKNYVFYNMQKSYGYPISTSTGMYEEEALLCLDDGSIQMLADITTNRDNQENQIEVILEGTNETFSLKLSDELVDGMIHLYNLFVESGGIDNNNLYLLPQGVLSSWQSSNN